LIADEIATGFGRTGDLFATQAAGVVPDIMCVGKAMTGGFMTMAATLATAKVAEGMRPRALMHGPTFMANPLACAVSAAATELIVEGHWREQVAGIEKQLQRGLADLAEEPGVADVRVLGAIGVVEMEREVNMAAATAAAVEQGVWLRPFGRLIYIMPPFISTADEVTQMCRGVRAAVAGGRQ
ncbi:aminotransferase class III-fold pyridoxal phosphate-dependent enzyme, partial [Corynebacterium sp.]